MKKIIHSLLIKYRDASMTKKISVILLMILIPVILFVISWFYNVLEYNNQYKRVVKNTSVISEFSIDFKKNYDYKIYLIIVGNKSYEESKPLLDIEHAREIIAQVRETTEVEENKRRIDRAGKYLDSLERYTKKIEDNLRIGGMYDENNEIWNNDVMLGTAAIRDTVLEILYFETKQSSLIYTEMQHMTQNMIMASIILIAFLFGVAIMTIRFVPKTITKPIRSLSKVTEQVAKGNLSVRADELHGAELSLLGESLNVMIEKISSLIESVKTEQKNLREAELEILQMQINPHFLYNTLDTIIWLSEAGDKAAVVNMVETLSEFFRSSLNNGNDIVSIESEKRHISSYLQIQQVRYQDILEYEINIPRELNQYVVPKITLQPLVENALYHGIKNKRGKGHISVCGHLEEDCAVLTVSDNGIGMTEERFWQVANGLTHKIENSNDFYGLYNVNERIRLKFGEPYGIHIESVYGEGTEVSIRIPFLTVLPMVDDEVDI